MRQFPGLWGQQLAPPLVFPRSIVMLPLAGPTPYKGLEVGRSVIDLSASAESAAISTPWFDLIPTLLKRDNLFATSWRQLSGPAGVVETDGPLRARFNHVLGGVGSNPVSWLASLVDKYGRTAEHRADFVITRSAPPPPPLEAYVTPSEIEFRAVDPVTRRVTINFSVTVTSGVPPYTYDWGGGDSRYTAANSTTLELPVGSSAFHYAPGCVITDDLGRYLALPVGPFYIHEP